MHQIEMVFTNSKQNTVMMRSYKTTVVVCRNHVVRFYLIEQKADSPERMCSDGDKQNLQGTVW